MIRTTLAVYRQALGETGRALGRGPAAWVGCILMSPITMGVAMLVSPLGLVGGFILGFVSIGLFGAYLSLVALSLDRKKALGFGVLRESVGQHLWDVMGIAFVHWILMMCVGMLPGGSTVGMLLGIVGFILFNPWPEVIHTDRVQGTTEILTRAFRFMSSNGPEWVVAHLVLIALGGLAIVQSTSSFAMVGGLLSGVLLHPVMVFRGALYRGLSSSSRRSRAWKARF